MEYRYHLLKYRGKSSRLTCPACGRPHCLTPYVDAEDHIIGPQYGRCDHESSCGYISYPPSEYVPIPHPIEKSRPDRKPCICTIPMDIVLRSVRTTPASQFIRFLLTIIPADTVSHIISEYLLGVTRSGDVVFYQIDVKGRCRTGKVMTYNPVTGHRVKESDSRTPITWVHTLLKQQGTLPQEWQLTQCLFGEHLLSKYPDKTVCLVESEKTAVICACINPECVWLATGGKGQLNDRIEVLSGRRIIAFPDVDGYDTWLTKASTYHRLDITVSDLLERNATPEDRQAHIDIADLLIRQRLADTNISTPDTQLPSPDGLYLDNPVMREVMKYISPQHWDKMDLLIRTFDLELISITKNKPLLHSAKVISVCKPSPHFT